MSGRAGVGRGARAWVSVVVGVALAILVGLPVAAVAGPTRLLDPLVTPSSGEPGALFRFEVTYRNREGSPPDYVEVVVDGEAHGMTGEGDDWKAGVRFVWSTRLSDGTHEVRFRAMDRERFTDEIAGPPVVVATPTPSSAAPTATPGPDPTASPPPPDEPRPTASPTLAPTAGPSAAPSGTPGPSAAPSSAAAGVPSGEPSAEPGSTDPVAPSPSASSLPTRWPLPLASTGEAAPSPDPSGSAEGPEAGGTTGGPGRAGPLDEPPHPGGGGSTDTDGPFDPGPQQPGAALAFAALADFGLERGPASELRLLPAVVVSTGGVTAAMAMLFLGKRRRDGEPTAPDETLAANARSGDPAPADANLANASPRPAVAPPVIDPDAAMPRWRRPSLLAARKADPLRDAQPVARLSFDGGAVAPVDGLERRLIRYHVVELLDGPDELRSRATGSLTQGDEVQLLQRSGSYWRVLCPDGSQGWIHRMTLGDVVGAPTEADGPAPWASPAIPDDRLDGDLLAAFRAMQVRTGA